MDNNTQNKIKELRKQTGMNRKEFCDYFAIPYRTVTEWERDKLLAEYLGTNCPQVEMLGENGKKRKVLVANSEQLFRIIQSIPSPKVEPFKRWLAAVGAERIEETIDPEQAIDRAY